MKIQYLGTAAAEGIPALFCDCPVCKKARELGGREIRTRSQAIIDDGKLVIDFPADTYQHFLNAKIDSSKIENILITHTHPDHFYPADFGMFEPEMSHFDEGRVLRVYGSEDIVDPMKPYTDVQPGDHLQPVVLEPFVPVKIGEYVVTPMKAAHGTPHPYIYMIEKGDKRMLYAHDTCIFPEETIAFLSEKAPKFDLVSFDCTGCNMQSMEPGSHMNIAKASYLRDEMEYAGFLSPNTVSVLNHFSHNGDNANYYDMEEIAMNEGFLLAYDGMTVEF